MTKAHELTIFKSVDLHSAAYAHLCASLLKIKAVAESPKLPDDVKNGVPKPDISEEEKSLLHNVTSALYNQPKVRDALDKAVADICRVLQVPVPDKKGKLKKGDKKAEETARKNANEQLVDRIIDPKTKPTQGVEHEAAQTQDKRPSQDDEGSDEEETEFSGFSDDEKDESDEEIEEKEERVMSRFNDRLGSSDDDEYDTANEELDPMEITDISASEGSDDNISLDDSGSEQEATEDEASQNEHEDEEEDEEESDSSAVSPPPKARKEAKKGASTKIKDTHYLPSLMGGYISGSESEASDIDVAPTRKNRRGQRARQAIAEKKFKDKAKHLTKQKAGRDDGWDLKRGAVGGNEKTPWKKGIRAPFEQSRGQKDGGGEQEPRRPRPPTRKDNEGPLHASWEAKKKAQEAQKAAVYQGRRVVFD